MCCWNPEERWKDAGFGAEEGAVGTCEGSSLENAACLMGGSLLLSLPLSLLNDTGSGVVLRPIRSGQREGCCLTHLVS